MKKLKKVLLLIIAVFTFGFISINLVNAASISLGDPNRWTESGDYFNYKWGAVSDNTISGLDYSNYVFEYKQQKDTSWTTLNVSGNDIIRLTSGSNQSSSSRSIYINDNKIISGITNASSYENEVLFRYKIKQANAVQITLSDTSKWTKNNDYYELKWGSSTFNYVIQDVAVAEFSYKKNSVAWQSISLSSSDKITVEYLVGDNYTSKKIYKNSTLLESASVSMGGNTDTLEFRFKYIETTATQIHFDSSSNWTKDDELYNFNWGNSSLNKYILAEDYDLYKLEYFKTGDGWRTLNLLSTDKITLKQLSGNNYITRSIYINDNLLVSGTQGSVGNPVIIDFRYSVLEEENNNNTDRLEIYFGSVTPFYLDYNSEYLMDLSSGDFYSVPDDLLEDEFDEIFNHLLGNYDFSSVYFYNGIPDFVTLTFKSSLNGDYYPVPSINDPFFIEFDIVEKIITVTSLVSSEATVSFPFDDFELDDEFFIKISLDDYRPALSGKENFVTNFDDPKDVEYFQSFLMAIDDVDGDLTDDIYIITDNYTPNKLVLGKHSVVFGVEDSAGNESTFEVFITVADVTKPVISGNITTAEASYTATYNINAFKSTLTVTDNYDVLSVSDITIKSDTYSTNKTKLGTYQIVFTVTDSSGNVSDDFIKQIKVVDDIPPVINGTTTYFKPKKSILTVSEIKSNLTAYDDKEGNVTSSIYVISDNYTGNGDKYGTYTIIFGAQDSSGNIGTISVTVKILDDQAPVWYIKDGVSIILNLPDTLTREQIVNLLIATNQINVTSYGAVTFAIDEYTGNENQPGVYMMMAIYSDSSGNEETHNFNITVLGDSDETPIEVTPENWLKDNYIYLILGVIVVLVLYYFLSKPTSRRRRRR